MANELFRKDTQVRASEATKNANDKQWYKDYIKRYCRQGGGNTSSISSANRRNKKRNYNVINNIINIEDYKHILMPYGDKVGEVKMPAKLTNKDIISPRLKAVKGMAMKRPFNYRLLAVNPEATTRIEQEEMGRLKTHLDDLVVAPIRERVMIENEEALLKRDLSPEERDEIRMKIQEEIAASTPREMKKYMAREHQDPAEIYGNQILADKSKRLDLERKFNKCLDHLLISGYEHMYVGIRADKTVAEVVNTKYLEHDMNPDHDFTEEGEWAAYKIPMSKSKFVLQFGDELTNDQLDRIYAFNVGGSGDNDFDFNAVSTGYDTDNRYKEYHEDNSHDTLWVTHVEFKALRKIGILYYPDENGDEQAMLVHETYKADKEAGERVEWEWLPELYEGYVTLNDIFVGMRPVLGQFTDLDNLGREELSYKGVRTDYLNSVPTSFVGRQLHYQAIYNIIQYRVELLMAADKGKKVAVNVKLIPETAGMSVEKWTNYFESSPFMYYNPDEEGIDPNEMNTLFKVIDLSTTKQISEYVQILEFIDKKCGDTVGVGDAALGNISASAEVGNTKQQMASTSNILEPYMNVHEIFKMRVLLAVLETAKIEYSLNPPEYLNYILDDMSREIARIDMGIVKSSTYGLYMENGSKLEQVKADIQALAHAAMQTDKVDFADILRLLRQDDTREAEEDLRVSEQVKTENRRKEQEAQNKAAMQQIEAQKQANIEDRELDHKHKMEEIAAKGAIDLQKQAMLSMGFNEDKDMDNDGVPDVVELYRNGADAAIKQQEVDVKRGKLELEKEQFKEEKKQNKAMSAKKE